MSRRRTPPTRDRGALLFTPRERPHEKRAAGLNHGSALCILVIVWGVEFQEVSPRPGRTTVALGLRVFRQLHLADFSHDGADAGTPLASARPAPSDRVRNGQEQFSIPVNVFIAQPVVDASGSC